MHFVFRFRSSALARTAVAVNVLALVLTVTTALPARADRDGAIEALTSYTDAVAERGEPTSEMLEGVARRLLEALPPERATSLVIDRMLSGIGDPTASAALVLVLDELGLPRGELLSAAVDRLATDDATVRDGAVGYLGGFLVRPEIDIDTKLLVLELLEPAAAHAAPLAPSLLALQLLHHGRNMPSTIAAIDRLLAKALPDQAARVMHGVPGLVELARADEGNLRGLAMLKLGEWGIATPAVVDVLLENVAYKEGDAALVKRVRIVAIQTLGDLAQSVARLDPTMVFTAQRTLVTAGASEPDEGLRDLIVHVSTVLGHALSRTTTSRPSNTP